MDRELSPHSPPGFCLASDVCSCSPTCLQDVWASFPACRTLGRTLRRAKLSRPYLLWGGWCCTGLSLAQVSPFPAPLWKREARADSRLACSVFIQPQLNLSKSEPGLRASYILFCLSAAGCSWLFFFFFFHVNELCWKAKWEEEKNRVSVHGDVCVCVCAYLYRQGESSRHIIFPFSFN